MRDEAYSLALLPTSMLFQTVEGANAIEANLYYLLSLFPRFLASVRKSPLGSLGYLELSETCSAGEGFLVETSVRINRAQVTVTGEDLTPLFWSGSGWREESGSRTQLILVCDNETGYWDAAQFQGVLSRLVFGAAADADTQLSMTALYRPDVIFDPVGPVHVYFRSGATWALIESRQLTWVQAASMTWDELAAIRKDTPM